MKTQMSRFHIHDDLIRPRGVAARAEGRDGVRRAAPELPRRARRFSGGAARIRALPVRAAPRQPHAPDAGADRARGRRALPQPARASRSTRAPRARPASASTRSPPPATGSPPTRARRRCCATCAPCVEQRGHAPMHLHEEAREAGWSDEQLLEAIAYVSPGVAHRDGQRRRRGAGRRLGRRHPRPAGRVGL